MNLALSRPKVREGRAAAHQQLLKVRIIRVVLTQQEQGADGILQEFLGTLSNAAK